MKISLHNDISGDLLTVDDLISNFSTTILKMTDDRIKEESSQLEKDLSELEDQKVLLSSKKEKLNEVIEQNSKLRLIYNILNKIQTMKMEFMLIGEKRVYVKNILNDLFEKDMETLKNIDHTLLSYLPDKYVTMLNQEDDSK